jgi:acetyl/propionyl-CoA carboxylase alpha subunit
MLKSVLIANRGEIARRVIRTARRLGVRTVAVHLSSEAHAPHVREADAAVLIDSHLDGAAIIAAAKATGAEAIHPGYGFLSENAGFAQAVIDAGLIWVGPPPSAILAMGLKDAAKKRMAEAGVPVTPGYLGEDQSLARLQAEADAIGYPVLIKAVAGGGGKGMRKVDSAADFAASLASCRREASASFGDDKVLLETYVARPRHLEVQVFADTHGQVVHLFERDCSLQRRHQKVIEEAPAPGMDAATRAAVCEAAVKAARAVGYVGAGTIEFIADASQGLRADRIWFMEMNTRLQVEHPVTEAITGQDLVEWQLRVASGEPLPLGQDQLTINGWAMEARLYAENPSAGFLPSTGPLTRFRLPQNVRVDAGLEEGGAVTAQFDPMIAKLIVHAPSREQAAQQLAEACRAVEVWPVKTNAGFLARALDHPDFVAGDVDTGFIAARLETLVPSAEPPDSAWATAAAAAIGERPMAGFRLNAAPRLEATLQSGDTVRTVAPGLGGRVFIDGETTVVFEAGDAFAFAPPRSAGLEAAAGNGAVTSPMPGRIVGVAVTEGEVVRAGQALLTVEAMKMEHTLIAPFDGVVAELTARAGAQVSEGAVLARLEKAE